MNRLICHWVNLFAVRQHVYAGLYLERASKPACGSGGAISVEFIRQMREGIAVG
jgi:hypothetical protein